MKLPKKHSKKIWILPVALLTLSICVGVIIFTRYNLVQSPAYTKTDTNIKKPTNEVKPTTNSSAPAATPVQTKSETQIPFSKTKYSTTDPSSPWTITNKQHQLYPSDFRPSDLVTSGGATISNKVLSDFEAMRAASEAGSISLTVVSSYRSYSTQVTLYNSYVASNGQTAADTFSARPGYSEHQTGLAIDFGSINNPGCNFDDCYATTAEGAWLASHASEYGFILRYTTNNQQITGYKNEPWHYRYVGHELAAEMKKQNISTLEEFFNVSGGVIYK